MIKIKRVYEPAEASDGARVLIDGLWPRGISKAAIQAVWIKEIAPSAGLRQWFNHEPAKWEEFKKRYSQELAKKKELLAEIKALEKKAKTVTLLYAAKEERFNNAAALKDYLL